MPEKNLDDAPGAVNPPSAQPPAAPPATPPAQPKVEIKDGVVTVDGKKYVKESDLIAAKESLKGDMEKAQAAHNEAVDKLRLDVDAAQKQVATANAALDEAKKARATGDISADEMSKVKQEADTAKAALATATASALDLRRKLVMATYQINPTSDVGKKLMEKDAAQLDSFEEAMKAISTSRSGPGNYLVGGGGGGPAPVSNMERAKALLANTPYRGTRDVPEKK